MDDAVITAIATAGFQLATLAAKGTAIQVSNRFQAIRQKKLARNFATRTRS